MNNKEKIYPGQTKQTFIRKNKTKFNYLLFIPKDYHKNKKKKWPAIIFIHGSGEAGKDIEKVKKHGPPKLVEKRNNFPFIVISPQYILNREFKISNKFIDDIFINKMVELYRIDVNRIYLTGISYGGFLTWIYSIKYPDKFAAIAPVCGFGSLKSFGNKPGIPKNLQKISGIPTWVFHGKKDDVVPISHSEIIVEALHKKGSMVKFTKYPEADHDAWTDTYEKNDKLYKWFMKNKKSDIK